MEEVITVIQDFGLVATLIIILLLIGLKYLPKFLDLKLNRMKEKDYMLDSFKSVIENNSQVINNNSEVIKLNSTTIKNYTDNAYKLEKNFDSLTNEVKESNKLMIEANANIEILKERNDKK